MRAGFWMAEKSADALIEFGADDVLELAGLVVSLGVVDGKCVFEKTLGQTISPDDVTRAAASRERQLHFTVSQFDKLEFGHARENARRRLFG